MGDSVQPLPVPTVGPDAASGFVERHLGHLVAEAGGVAVPSPIRGGQRAADAALAAFDVAGYAAKRNEVNPAHRRGASMLSPYIRHGLLPLQTVWDVVADGPPRDVRKFRDELLWQEFARHWYAHHGGRTRTGIRNELPGSAISIDGPEWDRSMSCIDTTLTELETTGWLVNQTRMWLSSHWAIRDGLPWRDGEDFFFRHLLDGSRAANRLGWQWTTGVGSSKPYGFSRWQVEKRAPGLCATCPHHAACPIQEWPDDPTFVAAPPPTMTPLALTGPIQVQSRTRPESVWLTAESLGAEDPALQANPDLSVTFVFDEPLLARLRLSAKRLVFLVETLAELGEQRDLQLAIGTPSDLVPRNAAATWAPVPGFARIAARVEPAELHPWPWLRQPTAGSVSSFSAWRKSLS